jgi:UPF0176 protein
MAAMENCCSTECQEWIHLPMDEQIRRRKGLQVGNKIFRKGKSENLKFKHSGELSATPLAKAPSDIRQKIKVKKTLLGKVEHYFVKAGVGLIELQNGSLQIGDTIVISGPTTGEQTLTLSEFKVNGQENTSAQAGDKVTFEVPFRVRLSDKVYKIIGL